MTFYSIIKPFQYVHPVIFNLPENKFAALGSPVPTIIGINQGLEYLEEEQIFQKYTGQVFIDLDNFEMRKDDEIHNEVGNKIPLFFLEESLREEYLQLNP